MKKVYVSVALVTMLIGGTASAQHSAQKIAFGVKGGVNLTNINNENGVKYDEKVGFNAGLIGHIHLAPQLALQPEVYYSAQGAKFTAATGAETKLNLNYINVPVLVQYMFDNGFRLQAGPQVGFLVSAKSSTNNTKSDIKSSFKGVDFGLGAGIGYVHPPSGFGIDLRYNLGLSDITENTALNTSKSTNRGGQLGVFYLIKHK